MSSAILDKLNNSFNRQNRSLDGESTSSYDHNKENGPIYSKGTLIANLNGCKMDCADHVLGLLHDVLQKEVIILRNSCQDKDHSLKDKNDAIETFSSIVEEKAKWVFNKLKGTNVATAEILWHFVCIGLLFVACCKLRRQ